MTDPFEPASEHATREELLAQIEELRHAALHDALTGAANRTLFQDRLEHARALARRTRAKFAVLVIDLDGFKAVNDRYGHAVGDAVLRETAERLRVRLRESDTVARFGGDEFGLVLFGAGHAGVENVVRELRVELTKTIRVGDLDVATGVSIGAAVFPDDATEPMELLRIADRAMYRGKQEGAAPGAVAGTFRKLGGRLRGTSR